jgi:hypothetical protein
MTQCMSFGVVLTKIPCCSLKDQCQETYCRDPEGPRPLEGSLRADGVGDQAGARLARSGTTTNRTASPATRSNRQMSARLGLASAVREGGQRVCGRPCAKHGARALSPDRIHALHEGLPQEVGVQEAGELRGQLSELAATIIGDINLCGTPTPPSQGTPTTSAPGSSSRPPRTAVSTSQS